MSEARRVIAITGAGGALGGALSRRFAGEPDTDLVLSDVSEPSLDSTVDGLGEREGAVETLLADVSDVAQVEAVVALAVERFGRLDVLISNAGVLAHTAQRRWGGSADLAGAYQFLASDASAFVTGIVLNVDGGYLLV